MIGAAGDTTKALSLLREVAEGLSAGGIDEEKGVLQMLLGDATYQVRGTLQCGSDTTPPASSTAALSCPFQQLLTNLEQPLCWCMLATLPCSTTTASCTLQPQYFNSGFAAC
jgi:hypothetical protein